MPERISSRIRVPIPVAIEAMVYVLGQGDKRLLLCSTVEDDEFVGPGNCFAMDDGLPSDEVLFELPHRLKAHAMLFGTPATGSVFDPERIDVDLTRRLIDGGERCRIPVLEHVLIKDNNFRLMRESLADGLI